MTNPLSTETFRLQNCFRLIDDIVSANDYYLWVGDSHTHDNSSVLPVYDITSNTITEAYTNMIAGKKITDGMVFPVVRNIPWVSGTVYAMYEASNTALPDSNFYVVTEEGGSNHIWKVLDNNFAANSTIQPSVVFIVGSTYVQTADGYRWKYMTSMDTVTTGLFVTSDYIPLAANSTVEAGAIPGALDIFKLTGNGAFYNNYISGTLTASDIAVSGDQTLFNLSNSQVVTVNGYYTGCLFYITAGVGQGQYATITDYVSNTVGNLIKIQNQFVTIPLNGSQFEITPQLNVVADGLQTVNCVARALINANASNSIYRIESLEAGAGYFNVTDVSVVANVVVAISNAAVIEAVLPPKGGHGSNVFSELYSNSVGISIDLANTETTTILATNKYQQIGILKSPKFSNVTMNFSGGAANGVYIAGETVYGILTTQFAANVTVNASSTNVTCLSANFTNQLRVGDVLYLQGAANQLVTVNNIVNSSNFYITANATLSCTESFLSSITIQDSAYVLVGGQDGIVVTNCTPNFHTSSFVVGDQSGATGLLTSVTRAGDSKFFQTFQELYKYNAELLSGNLSPDEYVSQGNTSARVYAVTGSGLNAFVYLSNFSGDIIANGVITGNTSAATANLSQIYYPEVIFGSGDVLYLENISAVTRSDTQTETFVLILGL